MTHPDSTGRTAYHFHVRVQNRPAEARRGAPLVLDADTPSPRTVCPLKLTAEQRTTPFALSFEAAATQLELLPRLFFEPDGSFVWVGEGDGGRRWQVDGNLYDRSGQLQYVELKGECPAPEFNRLLATCGWPSTPLMFELPRHAIYLDEEEFRRWAG